MKKVLIAGTFDIIHPGHINLIKQAKEFGDFLVVVIARDKNVIKAKGKQPFFNEKQRLENLKKLLSYSLKPTHYKLVLGDEKDPYKIIREENSQVIALGYDQQSHLAELNELRANSNLFFSIERLEVFKEEVCKGKKIRKSVEDSQSGFLLIDKEDGWTSHDVVAKLRSILKIKQIGHTGTLDPFATGLLICAVGKATKMVGLFDVLAKEYEAEVRLGVTSDTYDRTGQIQKSKIKSQNDKTKLKINEVINSFIGKQQQLPPMYSAKKIQGKKLYELARKGKEVERKPGEIEIYNLELLNFDHQSSIINLRVKCSTGTYIRTLAYDIGQKLGTGAILEELKRTAIGDFNVSKAIQLENLTKDNYSKYLIKPLEALEKINANLTQNLKYD